MNIAFLASHNGSNMQAIIDACKSGDLESNPCVIISNNRKSGALERAANEDIPGVCLNGKTHPDFDELDRAICDELVKHNTDIVVLAGYMKKIGPKVLSTFKERFSIFIPLFFLNTAVGECTE